MDRFTAVIGCIFTAVIAVASVLQYRIFVKTDRTQYSTSRAYVFGGPGDRIKDPEGKFAGIILTYGNYGKTPAIVEEVNWSMFVEGRGYKTTKNCQRGGYQNSRRRQDVLNPEMKPITISETERPISGDNDYISCGEIVYCDVFNKRNFSQWAHRIRAPDWNRDETLVDGYIWGEMGDCKGG